MMKLRDACLGITDGSHNPPNGIDYSNYLMLSSKNISNNAISFDEPRYLSEIDFAAENKRTRIAPGDVLLTIVGTVGRVAIVKENMPAFTLQRSVAVLHPNTQICSSEYLMYALQGKQKDIEKRAKGVAQKGIYLSDLAKIDIEIPTLDQQSRIVVQMRSLSKIIDCFYGELRLLEDLIKARFVEMFGDPETNPKGWEQVTVGDVCSSIVRGPFGSALKKEFFVEPDETTYKVYEQKHAIQKSATIGTYYVTAEKYAELKRFECVPGDIIMSCSGTMGELYQLPEGCERGIINQALCKFSLNDRILPICFLTYIKQTINNLETKGSGIQNIAAVSYVKAMPINLPPMDVQQKFADFVDQVDKSKIAVRQALDKAKILFDSLMQKYFGKDDLGDCYGQ